MVCVVCVQLAGFQASPGPSDYENGMQRNERQAFTPQPDIFLIKWLYVFELACPGIAPESMSVSLYIAPGLGRRKSEKRKRRRRFGEGQRTGGKGLKPGGKG